MSLLSSYVNIILVIRIIHYCWSQTAIVRGIMILSTRLQRYEQYLKLPCFSSKICESQGESRKGQILFYLEIKNRICPRNLNSVKLRYTDNRRCMLSDTAVGPSWHRHRRSRDIPIRRIYKPRPAAAPLFRQRGIPLRLRLYTFHR